MISPEPSLIDIKKGVFDMMLDKKAIERLLSLDDAALSAVIRQLAQGAGIDATKITLGKTELDGIRKALSLATDGDASHAMDIIKNFKNYPGADI